MGVEGAVQAQTGSFDSVFNGEVRSALEGKASLEGQTLRYYLPAQMLLGFAAQRKILQPGFFLLQHCCMIAHNKGEIGFQVMVVTVETKSFLPPPSFCPQI